jgi:translocator protein
MALVSEFAMSSYLSLLPFVAAVALTAVTGSRFGPGAWYAALAKPRWTPPGWVFGPVWSVLYVMIAIAGWRVWHVEGIGPALVVWAAGLVLNMAWSWIMFGRRQIGAAFADIVLLWLAVAAFIVLAWPVDRIAAWLFVPYLAWASFAGALNLAIWRMNAGDARLHAG